MKGITFLLVIWMLGGLDVFSQGSSDSLKTLHLRTRALEEANSLLRNELKSQSWQTDKRLSVLLDSIVLLQARLQTLQREELKNRKALHDEMRYANDSTKAGIQILNWRLSHYPFYIAGTILGLVAIVTFLFFSFKKRLDDSKTDTTRIIERMRKSQVEDCILTDNKLTELIEKYIPVIEEAQQFQKTKGVEVDHSFALRMADEIVRIEKNLTGMDNEVRGIKQLRGSIKRIYENFESNGYEVVELLNKSFDEGMKVSASFRTDDNLTAGQQIISRIIRPQVNYKGIMIQPAQVEVSIGE